MTGVAITIPLLFLFSKICSMSKSPCHTHNNACFYWTTPRNDWIANVSISAPIFVLQEPPRSPPTSVASPTPRSRRASALGPLCMLTCSSDVPRRKVGAWEFGHAQFGAVLLGPMCAALSSDVPTERWGVGVRAHSGTVCIAIVALCLLPGPMCTARARTFLAERWDRGSTGAQRCLLLRPLGSIAPPCVRAAAGH